MMLSEVIERELELTGGILFGRETIVYRGSYNGNNFLGKNSSDEEPDQRGYWPVERWILSLVEAQNPVKLTGEGLTKVQGYDFSFLDAVNACEERLLGTFRDSWPLIKVLDIGGKLTQTSFGTNEIPPIPAHIHAGCTKDRNNQISCGKAEAQFFPFIPKDSSPITRMGFKKEVSKEMLLEAMNEFGKSDALYNLMNEYEVKEGECWMVRPGFVHAPGPVLTIEIQRPQDDFNFLAWKLGERINADQLVSMKNDNQLRGLQNVEEFVDRCIDWEMNVDPKSETIWKTNKRVFKHTESFEMSKIFHDMFDGEEWLIKKGKNLYYENDCSPKGIGDFHNS
ncbi:Oidioi.mRNA.OKI2018_I69.XSR.g14833.t1.cds [Oikopleura dioica]|uniref:Oidioi.mRNA.OKI2018_I69.XSR.g14833.t1.cds n=1 Tax=Oikopleura dioica TaxID=34765 RepID=A0ABN7SG05_OIKDI|nr:Oidioi.mRNA.OKI2018_I69.XSR.g14833.t1.cds [Oikopleura dioica]